MPENGSDFFATKVSKFEKSHGFSPDLANPRRFSEKLLKRILCDWDPYYSIYGRKISAPYFAQLQQADGLHFAKRLLVKPQITPADIDELPDAFVLKSSFASGLNAVVLDKSETDWDSFCPDFNAKLLTQRNAQGVNDPNNCVIVEEVLEGDDDAVPNDYKFHCFRSADGVQQTVLQVDTGRHSQHRQSMVDEHYERLDLGIGRVTPHTELPAPPAELPELFRIATDLARGFDYIRIDLYLVQGKVFFGEFTPFHQGGNGKVSSQEWDERLGEMWHQTAPCFQAKHF